MPTLPRLRLSPRARRTLFLRRRPIAIALLVLAALCAASALVPDPVSRRDVLVAIETVPPGAPIPSSALESRRLAADAVPADALTIPDEAAGRTAASLIPAGAALVPGHVTADDSPLALAPSGSTVLPVPVSDGSLLPLLTPGRRIVLVTRPAGSGSGWDGGPVDAPVTSVPAIVVAAPEASTEASAGVLDGAGGASVLVAVDSDLADETAAVLGEGWLTLTIPV